MSKRYAIIDGGIVENIAAAESPLDPGWIDVTDADPAPGIGWAYDGTTFTPPPPPAPEPRHISVGAFFDRFGSEKINILASTDAVVQALVRDASVRKFIDLDRPDLAQAMQILVGKGFNIDPDAILNAPVQPNEKP